MPLWVDLDDPSADRARRVADEFGFDEESTERLASSSVSELARSSRRREFRFLPALSPMLASKVVTSAFVRLPKPSVTVSPPRSIVMQPCAAPHREPG